MKHRKKPSLRFTIIFILLAVSIIPLALVSLGSWYVFGRLLTDKSLELQRTVVENHAYSIETFLSERIICLELIAKSFNINELTDPIFLQSQFNHLNLISQDSYVDLGVISGEGEHLVYIGQYDLMGRNYRETEWFKEVYISGEYISDVFLGYRQIPHCIIAIKSYNGNKPWFLRATINSEKFDEIVHTDKLGKAGEVYIVNRQGLYQTTPRQGSLLEKSAITGLEYFPGVRDSCILVEDRLKVRVTTWINKKNWLLAAEQDYAEIQAPVNKAIASGAVIVILAIALTIVVTFIATSHLTAKIDKANRQREEMFSAFMRSAKLASIGELATGLAHEINNPLAVISADQTNISDIISGYPQDLKDMGEIRESLERCGRQIQRCKSITTKMLQFGRKRDTELQPTDLSQCLQEIKTLLERQAAVRNVELILNVEENLPEVLLDSVELEQVMVNLINNSLQALNRGGYVKVSAFRQRDELVIEVSDNGSGIPQRDLDRIFEPFFTTKPIGEGTGLGLSVCYGLVQSWGGTITAESEQGKGTSMRIVLPLKKIE
ncbi:ATP-binding protein [bacterium]|nr:ATP-binding protein [FCB group bacterium]MBL7191619.1 ATP-binding protein [bacterium]